MHTLYYLLYDCVCVSMHAQICQYLENGDNVDIAPALSEEMWIEEDGTPYVYYANTDNKR